MIERAYMIFGGAYARYDAAKDKVDPGYPKAMGAAWPGFAGSGFDQGVDAAVNWTDGQVFFFRGPDYLRYHIAGNFVPGGYPAAIGDRWPGMAEAGFTDGLDAAVNLGTGRAAFFRGDQYLLYDIAADRVADGFPRAIASGWSGMAEAGFGADLDAIVNWGNGKLYAFKGDQYIRYDLARARVDDGYPQSIDQGWPDLGAARGGGAVDAVWTRAEGDAPGLSDAFFSELKAVSARLQCRPEDLLGVMLSESDVSPYAQNPNGKATGLIQFMPATLKGLGWTEGVETFRGLTAEAQLPWVEAYYRSHAGRLTSTGRLYLATYLPAKMGVADEHAALASRGEKNYDQNSGLDMNKDGAISIADLTARVASVQSGPRWQSLVNRL